MKGSNGKTEPSPEKIRTHITPKGQPFGVELRELWRYRELVVLFARKSLKVTYTQTVLGPLWLVLSPLLSSFVYLILFGHIAKLGTEGVPELLFYLCGTATWGFFKMKKSEVYPLLGTPAFPHALMASALGLYLVHEKQS